MKLFKILQLAILITCASFSSVSADHNENNGELVDRLKYDAQSLNAIVQASYLRYAVKTAVAEFAYEVNRLQEAPFGGSYGGGTFQPIKMNLVMDHIGPMNHGDRNENEYQLQRVQQAFYPVERYLYDTYSDFPRVYQYYLQTRQDLYALLGENQIDSISSQNSANLNQK